MQNEQEQAAAQGFIEPAKSIGDDEEARAAQPAHDLSRPGDHDRDDPQDRKPLLTPMQTRFWAASHRSFEAIATHDEFSGMESSDTRIHSKENSPPAIIRRNAVAIFCANLPALGARANMACRVRISERKMSLHQSKIESLPFVVAELNYLAPTPGKPRTYAFDPPPGEPKTTALPEPHDVAVFNGRAIAGSFSLDREGFAFVRQPTAVRDYYDEKEVRSVYYPAAEAFLQATLQADRVFIFDHTVRRRVDGAPDIRGAGPRQPATRVHVDQTVASGANRVREHLPHEAEELLRGRVQVINLWRPIRGPLRDAPLAMCDGRTVAPGDLVASDLVYPNRSGETYSVKYSPDHRWFYFPEMTVDEALLLKCYDSETDGRTRFGPHTAFTDPTTPPDALPRESIELRTLVFHKPR